MVEGTRNHYLSQDVVLVAVLKNHWMNTETRRRRGVRIKILEI